MKSKIGIITCYFGKFPWYFPYFLHSCKFNPTIDFIIITDCQDKPKYIPNNVFILKKSLAELEALATRKLGFQVCMSYSYKLCDFKPSFGFLFPDIIESYDFWGHGDIDVVYGDIRSFMTDGLLNSHDIISSRHDYITGTFCLYRNNQQMNTLFMQSKDYKKVFCSSEHFCFDECNFLFQELQNGASIFDYPDNIQSMTYIVQKAAAESKLRAFFDFIIIEGTPGRIKWVEGKIIYKDLYEAMFYHLIKFKTECKRPKILNPIPDTFYFTRKKILTKII